MEIDHHDHTSFNCDPKQCDVTDPDRNAEVVAKQPLQDQAACHGIERREDEHHGFGDVMENHVQEEEDHKEDDRQNDLEALLSPKFKLVLTGPCVDVSRWQCKLLAQ